MRRKVPQSVGECFRLIERAQFLGPWVMGADYSLADGYLFTLAQWMEADGVDPAGLPAIAAHRQRVRERPAVQRALAAERGVTREEVSGSPGTDHEPRSMRDPAVRQRRRAMLEAPHIAPLTAYAAALRRRGKGEVPEFDPMDGGVGARALFLFQKPGPMTSDERSGKRAGSGFISRNNDDPTAEATCGFMQRAGIARELTVIWNVVPWWNGTMEVTGDELSEGVACVRQLVALLPKLRAVILVGKKAAQAEPLLTAAGLRVVTSDLPSPRVRARWPERWNAIASDWAEAGQLILDP
jgi:hypothetical protein